MNLSHVFFSFYESFSSISCPGNGTVTCEFGDNGGPNDGDNCTLTCDPGFAMDGSTTRMVSIWVSGGNGDVTQSRKLTPFQ